MSGVVIIGAGHAAAQLCASLREQKVEGPITVVGNEGQLPYHRPPLSKTFVKDDQTPVPAIRPASYYEKLGVTLVLDDAATAIDREARRLTLASGRTLDYDWLVIATGARARRLPTIPPGTGRVHELRNAADALGLRQAFAGIDSLTVIGGGFIGLEIAATARQLGKRARVIEAAGRLLGRAVSPELSDYLLRMHREAGVDIALEARIDEVVVEDGELVALVVDGQREPVEALVVGIGAEPVVELAKAAGLDCANGVVVDASMRTADPAILAIGDCVSFPRSTGEGMLRLESVQNANDQARCAALTIAGRPAPYAAPAWFWSDQGSVRIQIAGLAPPEGERLRRPGSTPESFSILHYVGDALVCVESINAPADHLAARKMFERGKSAPRAQAIDPAVPLKSFM